MLKGLSVRNFRNLSIPKLNLSSGRTILVGENGQGKTNLLEAVYLLAYAKPLRGTKEEAINWQEDEAAIFGETEGSKIQIPLRRSHETGVFINNKPRAVSALFGKFLTVIFYPQEIELITGPPSLRRNFLDRLIATVDKDYLLNLISYQRALSHKNRLLKERAEATNLEVWDKQLASLGSRIWLVREEALSTLNQIFKLESTRLVGKPLSLEYKNPVAGVTTKEAENIFLRKLAAQKELERQYLVTIFGPHRDDFRIIVEETRNKSIIEKDLSTFGSRGEQRQGAILLKLASAKFFGRDLHQTATLLLDDVASELDANNRQLLLTNLPANQAIITTTSLESLPEGIKRKATIFTIKEGKVLAN